MENSIYADEFKGRLRKAKKTFHISEISKTVAYEFVRRYHYLGDAKFFCVRAFGLYTLDTFELVGVATFSLPQGNVALKGWFGLSNQVKDIYELSRLCLDPKLNGTNATSYLLGGSIRMLKNDGSCRAVITLADSNRHVGSIYQVCNFKYYGLTDKKSDFFREDGTVNPRGKTKEVRGVWIPRTQKHRYCFLIDQTLNIRYTEQKRPNKGEENKRVCCGGLGVVRDNRFGDVYTCPYCCGKLNNLTNYKRLEYKGGTKRCMTQN